MFNPKNSMLIKILKMMKRHRGNYSLYNMEHRVLFILENSVSLCSGKSWEKKKRDKESSYIMGGWSFHVFLFPLTNSLSDVFKLHF